MSRPQNTNLDILVPFAIRRCAALVATKRRSMDRSHCSMRDLESTSLPKPACRVPPFMAPPLFLRYLPFLLYPLRSGSHICLGSCELSVDTMMSRAGGPGGVFNISSGTGQLVIESCKLVPQPRYCSSSWSACRAIMLV